jgi:hypothetical protein
MTKIFRVKFEYYLVAMGFIIQIISLFFPLYEYYTSSPYVGTGPFRKITLVYESPLNLLIPLSFILLVYSVYKDDLRIRCYSAIFSFTFLLEFYILLIKGTAIPFPTDELPTSGEYLILLPGIYAYTAGFLLILFSLLVSISERSFTIKAIIQNKIDILGLLLFISLISFYSIEVGTASIVFSYLEKFFIQYEILFWLFYSGTISPMILILLFIFDLILTFKLGQKSLLDIKSLFSVEQVKKSFTWFIWAVAAISYIECDRLRWYFYPPFGLIRLAAFWLLLIGWSGGCSLFVMDIIVNMIIYFKLAKQIREN